MNLYNDIEMLNKKQDEDKKRVLENIKKKDTFSFIDQYDLYPTILVVGGKGNIGSYIVDYLCSTRRNTRVIVLDNDYNSNEENLNEAKLLASSRDNVVIEVKADIANYYTLYETFRKFEPNFVFHQASMLTQDSEQDRRRAFNTNVKGMFNILEACKEFDVKKLVYASSASVFGNPDYLPVDELHNFNNCKLLYGHTKVCCEQLAKYYADTIGMKIVGLRYFNVYSERQSTKNFYTQIVPKWINAFLEEKNIEMYGDGKQTIDMIHAKDVARFNVLAMDSRIHRNYKDLTLAQTFDGFINVGTGVQTSVKELYFLLKEILEEFGINTAKSCLYYIEHDPAIVKRRQCDISLQTKLLGICQIDLRTGMTMTVKSILKKKGVV